MTVLNLAVVWDPQLSTELKQVPVKVLHKTKVHTHKIQSGGCTITSLNSRT